MMSNAEPDDEKHSDEGGEKDSRKESDDAVQRKIIHIDMDAFFAAVEQRDHPELRGKPVAVGGSAKRGVVAAASYEARVYGVKSAMPSVIAIRRCPELIFVPHRFDVYREVSRQIRTIFAQYTDLIEPLSLDEAYLDVTHDKQDIGSAVKIAKIIRAEIERVTGLTASAGISYNKFIAKIASDQNKPNGMCVILPADGPQFVASLPVRRFHGVGPRTAEKMAALGVHKGADLLGKDEHWFAQNFGSWGEYLFSAARGIDHRPVSPHRIRKSIGAERTYGDDKWSSEDLIAALDHIIDIVWERIENNDAQGRTITLKAKYSDFQQITRSQSLERNIADKDEFRSISLQILDGLLPTPKGIRLLGLTLANLEGVRNKVQAKKPQKFGTFFDALQESFDFS